MKRKMRSDYECQLRKRCKIRNGSMTRGEEEEHGG